VIDEGGLDKIFHITDPFSIVSEVLFLINNRPNFYDHQLADNVLMDMKNKIFA